MQNVPASMSEEADQGLTIRFEKTYFPRKGVIVSVKDHLEARASTMPEALDIISQFTSAFDDSVASGLDEAFMKSRRFLVQATIFSNKDHESNVTYDVKGAGLFHSKSSVGFKKGPIQETLAFLTADGKPLSKSLWATEHVDGGTYFQNLAATGSQMIQSVSAVTRYIGSPVAPRNVIVVGQDSRDLSDMNKGESSMVASNLRRSLVNDDYTALLSNQPHVIGKVLSSRKAL